MMGIPLTLGLTAAIFGVAGMAFGATRRVSNWRDFVMGGSTTFLLGMTLIAGEVIPPGLVRSVTQWVLAAGVAASLVLEVTIARRVRS